MTDYYQDPGATASDAEDGDITSRIVKTITKTTTFEGSTFELPVDNIPLDTEGTYTINYSVTDNAGVSATTSRQVNVSPGGSVDLFVNVGVQGGGAVILRGFRTGYEKIASEFDGGGRHASKNNYGSVSTQSWRPDLSGDQGGLITYIGWSATRRSTKIYKDRSTFGIGFSGDLTNGDSYNSKAPFKYVEILGYKFYAHTIKNFGVGNYASYNEKLGTTFYEWQWREGETIDDESRFNFYNGRAVSDSGQVGRSSMIFEVSSATQHPHIDGTHTSSLKSFADIVDEFNAGTLAGTTPVEGAQFGIGFGGTGNGRKTVEELVNSKLEPYLGCGVCWSGARSKQKTVLTGANPDGTRYNSQPEGSYLLPFRCATYVPSGFSGKVPFTIHY